MNQVEQSVAEYVDEVWEDVVADIEQLVSYPSVAVAADAEPGAPFGRPVRDALDCALGIFRRGGIYQSRVHQNTYTSRCQHTVPVVAILEIALRRQSQGKTTSEVG